MSTHKRNSAQQPPPEVDSQDEEQEFDDGIPYVWKPGPDGKLIKVPATEAQIAKMEKNAMREVEQVEEANEILAMLDSPDTVHVVPAEIELKGKLLLFHFKVLSHAETAFLEAKKWRKDNNKQLVRDVEHEETNGSAWMIHICCVKNVNKGKVDSEGNELPPKWEPFFTVAQIREKLMKSGDPKTTEFLYNLTAHCWNANPTLNPILRAQAAEELK